MMPSTPERSRPAYQGSTRRSRLPENWPEIRAEAARVDPAHRCHWCATPGGTTLDHVRRGDDHTLDTSGAQLPGQGNLAWIHDWRDVQAGVTRRNCHGEKTGSEAAAARGRLARPTESHPAFG